MKQEIYIDSDGGELIIIEKKNFYLLELTKQYYNSKNQLHRLDGPAIISDVGIYEYWINNKRHRIGGPAYYEDFIDGDMEWWANGKQVKIYYING